MCSYFSQNSTLLTVRIVPSSYCNSSGNYKIIHLKHLKQIYHNSRPHRDSNPSRGLRKPPGYPNYLMRAYLMMSTIATFSRIRCPYLAFVTVFIPFSLMPNFLSVSSFPSRTLSSLTKDNSSNISSIS